MLRLLVHVEGQTEEAFVNELLCEHLLRFGGTVRAPAAIHRRESQSRRLGCRHVPLLQELKHPAHSVCRFGRRHTECAGYFHPLPTTHHPLPCPTPRDRCRPTLKSPAPPRFGPLAKSPRNSAIGEDDLEHYGRYKAKVSPALYQRWPTPDRQTDPGDGHHAHAGGRRQDHHQHRPERRACTASASGPPSASASRRWARASA